MLLIPASRGLFAAAFAFALGGCHVSAYRLGGTSADPARAAEDLLQRVARQSPGEAYSEMAPAFRAAIGPNAWAAMVKAFDLQHFERVAWDGAPDIAGNSARLKGQLFTPGTLASPIAIDMARDGDAGFWRVSEIHLHRDRAISVGGGNKSEGEPAGVPMLTGAQLGAICRGLLAPTLPFQSVNCVDSVPPQPGAASLCIGALGNRMLGISARINSYDPTLRNVNVHCEITDPLGPAAVPAPPAGAPRQGAAPSFTRI